MSPKNKKRAVRGILAIFFLFCLLAFEGGMHSRAMALSEVPYSNLWKRISMDFKDANLKDVLKIFSQQAGLNFIAAKDIEDLNLTLYLDNVTVKQALDKLLSANSLIYELDSQSSIFVVKRSTIPELKTITKVFSLKFAQVPGSRLGKESSSGLKSATEGLMSSLSGEDEKGEQEGGITDTIKNILTEYGKIDVDIRTNSLIVTDIPERFSLIEEVIAKLDAPLPQIMIEVEMLDVSKNAIDALGVKWPQSILKLDVTGARGTTFPFDRQDVVESGDIIWGDPFKSPGGTDFKDALIPLDKFPPNILKVINAELALDFLKTLTDTKFLARPRILTLNNETAEIKIATQEAIGIKTESATNSSGAAVTSTGAERSETGVVLRVTPQADLDSREITMFIQPTVAESKTGGTFGGTTFKDPEIRTTKTSVRIKDGQTLMIGGLIRTKSETTKVRTPLLSNIPLFGAFFRHKDKTENERELVVFITPRILDGMSGSLGLSNSSALAINNLDREQSLSVRELEIERMLKQYDLR